MMKKPRRNRSLAMVAAAVTLGVNATALAIHPGRFSHSTESDFQAGKTDGTVVTNLGDVKLSAQTTTVAETPEDAGIFYDLQQMPGGAIYAAAGAQGALFKYEGDAIEPVLTLDDGQIFALAVLDGRLLVGVSAEGESRLAVLEADNTLRTVVALPEARYVWDMLVMGREVVVATGIDGRVHLVRPDLAPGSDPTNANLETILEAEQPNILTLAADSRGRIYAGSDADGLVYRLTPNAADAGYDAFVIFDAPEPEIGALVVGREGVVYAGTADAEQARPGRLEEAVAEETGRPQVEEAAEPEEAPPEEAPEEPGDLPQVPPQPEPIEPPADTPDQVEPDPEPQPEPDAATPDAPAPAKLPEQSAAEVEAFSSSPAGAIDFAVNDELPEPTPQQRDELRQAIRERLDAAKETGELQSQPRRGGLQVGRSPQVGRPNVSRSNNRQGNQQGNAIYRIDADGFVTEVFRESAMILRLVVQDDHLLAATGNEGQVFRIDPQAEETTVLADLEPQQATSLLLVEGEGDNAPAVLVGTANPAQIVRLGSSFADTGTYTSPALDGQQISLWGQLQLTGRLPEGTAVSVQTRSGNVQDPEHAPWSAWSEPTRFEADQVQALRPVDVEVTSPPARFVQYRLTLHSSDGQTPAVDRVELAHLMPNVKPRIASVQAEYEGNGNNPVKAVGGKDNVKPQQQLNIEWEASDANEDSLRYELSFRPVDGELWLPLAEDLTATSHEWDTRRVPDGWYTVRVQATDAPDNPRGMALTASRHSDPVLVDNTAPALAEGIDVAVEDGQVVLSFTARDELSAIAAVHYAVDSTDDWQAVLPEDMIYDSTSETLNVTIPDLAPGAHVVTLRVSDRQGNRQFKALSVEVK